MNIPRSFVLVGVIYLIIGVLFGMYMGGSGDHTLAPVHAHINLLGFTLMTVFGVVYKVFPAMQNGKLATIHFWLHLVGTVVLLGLLFLFMSGRVGESAMMPLAPLSEAAIFIGVLVFGFNALRNLR